MTVQDELLQARLEKHRQEAYEACAALLAENGQPAVLVDVEHLFDGQGLFFYFLGDVSPAAGSRTRSGWPQRTKPRCSFASSPKR